MGKGVNIPVAGSQRHFSVVMNMNFLFLQFYVIMRCVWALEPSPQRSTVVGDGRKETKICSSHHALSRSQIQTLDISPALLFHVCICMFVCVCVFLFCFILL